MMREIKLKVNKIPILRPVFLKVTGPNTMSVTLTEQLTYEKVIRSLKLLDCKVLKILK